MLWNDGGNLDPSPLSHDVQQLLVDVVTERASGTVRPGHFFMALIDGIDDEAEGALAAGLHADATPRDLAGVIEAYCACRQDGEAMLTGNRDEFSAEAQAIIADLEMMLSGGNDELPAADPERLGTHHVWLAALRHPDRDDSKYLGERDLLDFEAAVEGFRRLLTMDDLPPLFDQISKALLLDFFSDGAIAALEEAAESAGTMGYGRIMPAHLFLALLMQPEGPAEWAVRMEAPHGKGPADVAEEIKRQLSAGRQESGTQLELDQDHVSSSTEELLEDAMRRARLHGRDEISLWDLSMAVALVEDERLKAILGCAALQMTAEAIEDRLRQYERQGMSEEREPPPFTVPPQIGTGDDLTHLARRGQIPEVPFLDETINRVCKTLYRRRANHVLIVGDPGIGKTTAVRDLARRAAAGEIGFLERKRIVWVDTSDVAAEEAKTRLGELLALVRGRNDIILCIDGLGALLAADQRGSTGRPLLRAALKNGHIHMIGIMDQISYSRHLANDPKELQYCQLVEMEEPDQSASVSMLSTMRERLEEEYELIVEPAAIDTAVRLGASYILSERLPAKAVRLLRIACDNVAYERERRRDQGEEVDDDEARVTSAAVVGVVSEETGLPASTLRGTGDEIDYRKMLGVRVVGQENAIAAVARQLQLIKSGFKKPTKPASVMLFAGLTGTGKTELAKAIAQVYSASKTLQVYTMGNFTEEHSVSNLIGSPPGYVGYEQGGPLINELNADPYSVVLLDEVEKAHPEVWKPMLNLFDEGWIVDRRNMKAYGNRAVFILTTNAGAERIIELLGVGKTMEEVERDVREHLLTLTDGRNNPRFTPEFLARLDRIVVFGPLSREAMRQITRLRLEREAKEFEEVRDRTLTWDEEVVDLIGSLSHEANERADGTEGGRIVGRNVDEMILGQVTDLMTDSSDQFRRACGVHLSVREGHVELELVQPEQLDLDELTRPCLEAIDGASPALSKSFEDQIDELEAVVDRWGAEVKRWGAGMERPEAAEMVDELLDEFARGAEEVRVSSSEGSRHMAAFARSIVSQIRETVTAIETLEG